MVVEISEVENAIECLDVNKTWGIVGIYLLNIVMSALCLYLLCV